MRPSLDRSSRTLSKKSRSPSSVRAPIGSGDVVSPRAVTYSGTFIHCGSNGLSARRSLPSTCVYMWSVSRVSRHSAYGSGPQGLVTRAVCLARRTGRGWMIREEPGKRFGHRLDEACVLVARDLPAGEQAQRPAAPPPPPPLPPPPL